MKSGLMLPNHIKHFLMVRNAAIAAAMADKPEGESQIPRMQDNAEYQARCRMSRDEKFVGAVNELARRRQIFYEAKGEYKSFEDCKKEMVEMVVRKYARDHGIE